MSVRDRIREIRVSLCDVFLALADAERLLDIAEKTIKSAEATEPCVCGATFGIDHPCTVMPSVDGPEMMGLEPEEVLSPRRARELREEMNAHSERRR